MRIHWNRDLESRYRRLNNDNNDNKIFLPIFHSYLNKAIIGTLEGTLEKIKGFVSSKVYCRSCMLYACAKISQGSRVLVLIFVNKIFVIGKPLAKITNIFLLENFQLYGMSLGGQVGKKKGL